MTDFKSFLEEVQADIDDLAVMAKDSTYIKSEYYDKYDVKRGLRDINGKGVLTGLTEISDIISSKTNEDGKSVPCKGELYYRGIKIQDIVNGFAGSGNRYGFEESAYLLLFGKLPNNDELKKFIEILGGFRRLPNSFVRDIIMKAPTNDMMIALSRSVLTLYSYDSNPDDISITNVLR